MKSLKTINLQTSKYCFFVLTETTVGFIMSVCFHRNFESYQNKQRRLNTAIPWTTTTLHFFERQDNPQPNESLLLLLPIVGWHIHFLFTCQYISFSYKEIKFWSFFLQTVAHEPNRFLIHLSWMMNNTLAQFVIKM